MKIAVFTSYDLPYKPVADITVPVMMEYCARWGYELQIRQNPSYGNGIIWGRIDDFMTYDGANSWMVHLDADMLITNHAISLDSILSLYTVGDQDIVVGTDHNGVNDGFLAVKSARRWVLNKLWDTQNFDCFQTALSKTLLLDGHPSWLAKLPQREVNSYVPGEYPEQHPGGQWQQGDFMLHLPGRSNERRVELLNQYLPLIQR